VLEGRLGLLGRRAHGRLPDRLGLEESPQVGGIDWLDSALVCELLPPISEIASRAARMATRSAILLFDVSTWP
ncbi:MAG TPA: hypothetical protein VEX61_07995, partial [Burkholderiales bacterium]|nr:hypothetical protein [Burkholderiales bacterium]